MFLQYLFIEMIVGKETSEFHSFRPELRKVRVLVVSEGDKAEDEMTNDEMLLYQIFSFKDGNWNEIKREIWSFSSSSEKNGDEDEWKEGAFPLCPLQSQPFLKNKDVKLL